MQAETLKELFVVEGKSAASRHCINPRRAFTHCRVNSSMLKKLLGKKSSPTRNAKNFFRSWHATSASIAIRINSLIHASLF